MDLKTGEKCAKCGYDLTGLRSQGQCPECGAIYDKMRNLGIHAKSAVSATSSDELVGKISRIGCGVALVLIAMMIMGIGVLVSAFSQTLRGAVIGVIIGGIVAMGATLVLLGLRQEK